MGCIGGAIVGGLTGLLVALVRLMIDSGRPASAGSLDLDRVAAESCPQCGSLQVESAGGILSCNACGELTDLTAG